MSAHGESSWEKERLLLSYYGDVCRSHEAITDFRAKLLALLPVVSGAGIGLVAKAEGQGGIPTWFLVPLGAFGALVTVGLFFFEYRQMDECRALRNHGIWIERQLGLDMEGGRFGVERGCLGLRHIRPSAYRERERTFRKCERDGRRTEPLDKLKLGWINVGNADRIVYGAVFAAWVFVLAWGIKSLL